MKKVFALVVLAVILTLGLPGTSRAHESIFTFKGVDGNHLIMVMHNVHDARAGAPIAYNLRLYTIEGQLIPFQKAVAEVRQGKRVLKNETVAVSPNSDANFEYAYPDAGHYTLSLTFLSNSKQLAHSDFPIVVEPGASGGFFSTFFTVQSAVAFVLGVIATKLYLDRRLKLPVGLRRLLRKK